MAANRSNKVSPVEKEQGPAIGIHLGTTYSCVGVSRHGRVEIIANEKGSRTTPSCVCFSDAEILMGDAAKNQIGLNPANTIYGAKRLIGRKFDYETVQHDMKRWPFMVVAATEEDKKPMIVVSRNGEVKWCNAEHIAAFVLLKMKRTAESYLGSKVTTAVVTVPAYFNASQRQAIVDAGKFIELNVIRLVNEPIAAAVAYAFKKQQKTQSKLSENTLIFDFGGGTLDVSLLTVHKDKFEVKSTVGDAYLGGEDIDDGMVSHFAGEFERKHCKDIMVNPQSLARLRSACERAKKELSKVQETKIEIDSLFECIDFSSIATRALLKKLNVDLFEKCMDCVKKCVADGKMKMSDVHSVVLVGGSSKIPKVQQMLQDLFNGKQLYSGIDPEEATAYGAAILSEMLSSSKKSASTESELVDFTPLSLGIEIFGGVMSVVVPKNTPIPDRKTRVYTTVFDNQTKARFSVYEGERSVAKDNRFLHQFILADIPKAPARTPKFDVYFEMNSAGILTVPAEHRGTTNKKQIAIANHSMATVFKIELGRMIEEANKDKTKDDGSQQMKKIKPTNKFKKFAGLILKCIRKELMQLA